MPPNPRPPRSKEEKLSRALSKTLRHMAKAQGFFQDAEGWCAIDDLLSKGPYSTMNATRDDILEVVKNDKKGRYELNENKTHIRTVQGHSVEVDVGLEPLLTPNELPKTIVHGTYLNALPAIQKEGLKKMKRQYVHMAQALPGSNEVISGMRQSSEVYVFVDGPKALANGVRFFKSKNGVILSPDVIAPEFFSQVVPAVKL